MRTRKPHGFTLVEILVVIVIIGILAGITVPAVMRSIRTARQTALKLELNSIAQAVEHYKEKYGDYPPDGSSKAVLERHMRKLFPRMSSQDFTILQLMTDDSLDTTTVGTFSPVAMDRGEALVFFLGGFSNDVQFPITGPGGPLELIPSPTADLTDLANYQVNMTRDNALFDIDVTRVTAGRASATDPMLSTDETSFAYTNPELYGGKDLLPVYLAGGDELSPIVYFDSRTYGDIGGDYNGYLSGLASVGGIRPYKTELAAKPPTGANYATVAEAFAAIPFHNPNTFQLISPGLDGVFGAIVNDDLGNPVHFVTETGRPVRPEVSATTPEGLVFPSPSLGGRGYQDRDWTNDGARTAVNGHLDNSTNFIEAATLEGELQ
ncbi:Type II secretion system protein G precursor [Novipirellula aureliae]|uniref:Type II secretion system protein G n=1 Tax=Novipirellula aureliae TaxID=2527966 RepID=A0A5C6EC68_9BACT|nr:prepilin-type N-terminal cleavage/methylation domain-containing protein [Novipirellula aureliae]TWU45527.1 Type II secretion system protein G precursor [Novipirellula aureliae]